MSFEPLANSLLRSVMRAESAFTASELEQVANLREACRASAERFAELPTNDRAGFEAMRLCTNNYLQALQAILKNPKSSFADAERLT